MILRARDLNPKQCTVGLTYLLAATVTARMQRNQSVIRVCDAHACFISDFPFLAPLSHLTDYFDLKIPTPSCLPFERFGATPIPTCPASPRSRPVGRNQPRNRADNKARLLYGNGNTWSWLEKLTAP